MKSKEEILEKLNEIIDPEIGVGIVDLGLIYDVKVEGDHVHVLMTLTTIGCGLGGFFVSEIEEKLVEMGFEKDKIDIEITFDPPWSPERMKPELREQFGFF